MFGTLGAQIAKEAVNGAQADVACAGLAVSPRFQMPEEAGNLFHAQLFDFQQTVIAPPGGKLKQQLKTISVTGSPPEKWTLRAQWIVG